MYCLEIRSTGNWRDDVRYRRYTRSKRLADEFKAKVTRIQFTDSGHGLVPYVTECAGQTLGKPIATLHEHVADCLRK